MNDLLSRLHQLLNQADACMTQGIPADQFGQCADWCIKTYQDLSRVANTTPSFRQDVAVQEMFREVGPLITLIALRRK